MNRPADNEPKNDAAERDSAGGWLRFGSIATGLLIVCCGVHWLAADRLVAADTLSFALTGIWLVAVTAVAHALLHRGGQVEPIVGILGSMAIRVAGTFAILGGLLLFSSLERPEAVFNVLFWYITLTIWDVWGTVRSRGAVGDSSSSHAPSISGVASMAGVATIAGGDAKPEPSGVTSP
ncbi:MAG: hypothetical protein EA381_07355 [Planctomycetaceae bacterium]|nr:MAG: hypothetical protein EA381_07355 [Planctomycetaceae bacterium]